MVVPAAPGGPTFPVASAEALASQLEAAASDLEEAARLRNDAKEGMPEFQGTHAETYRNMVGGYVGFIDDAATEFRRTAGRLRDAIDEYHDARRLWFEMGQPI